MKYKIITVTLLILAIFSLYSSKDTGNTPNESLKIGITLPLTGKLGNLGEDIRGTIMVLEQNESFKKANIEFIIEDTKADPKEALAVTNRLISQNQVDFIISGPGSSATMAVVPLIEESRVPLLSLSATPNLEKAGNYIFRIVPSINEEVELTTQQMIKERYKNVAFIYDSAADSNVVGRDYFEKRFKELGGSNIFMEGYDSRTTEDFRSIITKTKNYSPDAYYFLGTDKVSAVFVKNITEFGIKQKVFGWSSTSAGEFLKNSAGISEGFVLSMFNFSCEFGTQLQKDFCESYKKINGRNPTFYAVFAFDLINIIAANNISTSEDILHLFTNKKHSGLIGNLNFSEDGNVVDKDILLRVVKDGVFVDYK